MLNIKKRIQLNNVLIGFGLVFGLGAMMAVQAADTVVNFEGSVTATNCVVNGGGDINVALPEISIDVLKALPTTSGGIRTVTEPSKTLGDIVLSGCPKSALVYLKNTNGSNSDTYLRNMSNSAAGGATGVGVALVVDTANGAGWFADGIFGVPVLTPIASGNDAIVRGIKVGYVKTSETPTIGSVSAAAEIVVQY